MPSSKNQYFVFIISLFCFFKCNNKYSKTEIHEYKIAIADNLEQYGKWFIIKEQFLFKKNPSLYLCVDNSMKDTFFIVAPSQANKFKKNSHVVLYKNHDILIEDSISIQIPHTYLKIFDKSKKLFGNVYIPIE